MGSFSKRAVRTVLILASVAAASFVITSGQAAVSAGGSSIASAPDLAAQVTGGGGGGSFSEYWKVSLNGGDKLIIDYQALNGGCASLYLFKPSVTDATLRDASYETGDESCSKHQISWTATGAGKWILQVNSRQGYALATQIKRGDFHQAVGGDEISSAPDIPQQVTFASGIAGDTEFWRVPMAAGDNLVIDYQALNDGCVSAYLFKPTVTDFTLRDASYVESDEACPRGQFKWTATGTGKWILQVNSRQGYSMVVSIRHPMTAALTGATQQLVQRGRSSSLPRSGAIVVTVTGPGGAGIPNGAVGGTLNGFWAGSWHKLQTGVVRGGKVTIKYRLPNGVSGPIQLAINLGGGSYIGKRILIGGLRS